MSLRHYVSVPKYQLILESPEQIPDDEFREHAKDMLALSGVGFTILEARNLEGIKDKVWRKDDYSDLL